ncbi:MAG TPA: Tat pathway signal sequence domain protein, partial [Dyadobacter sp.]|nr:Tat pathway signal sequence domain protein [Dyadobacter sp.]
FVRNAVVLAAGLPIASSFANAGNAGNKTPGEVPLKWLDSEMGAQTTGTTWGVPWPKGTLKKNSSFVLENDKGVSIPLQSWQTAQWPDGSVKWTAHAVGPQANVGERFILKSGKPQAITSALKVTETHDQISIDTGRVHCKINKKGKLIIDQIERDGKLAAKDGRLVLQVQNQPDNEPGEQTTTEFFQGDVKEAVLEQSGSVRAVVKITGSHVTENRSLLPYVVRLYFYDGSDAIRILHTIVYDADENKDFITGIGLRLQVPLEEEIHNRHVRFTGEENGVFAEAVRGLTGLRRDAGKAAIGAQLSGKATPATSEIPDNVSKRLHYIPAFGDYTLFQPTPDSFEIQKRTKAGHSWLQSAFGKRATGMAYVGSPKGGVLFGIRNFWQSHPAQLDIRNAHTDLAEITMWLWAPKSSAMDLRFYHDGMGQDTFEKQRDALEITYEDYEPEFGRPVGVARTSEMQLKIVAATPANAEISAFANALQSPAQLIAEPTYFAETGVFGGAFSIVSKGNPVEEKIDKQLDFYFDYYRKQVDQHKWYGFWNYGDVMHAYDYDRHTWRYDVGGYAWDNSELSTDLWLWYYFLRTGRSDVFRMAEAMTRHTGEVDVHHIGPFSPLGSRHNVMHWGCSAKQLRISTAANRRFYYYLTADERVGDLMKEQVDADKTLRTIIPGRKIGQKAPENDPKGELASISFGTDWGALASAWLTEWERTGDEKMKTKLLNSMK